MSETRCILTNYTRGRRSTYAYTYDSADSLNLARLAISKLMSREAKILRLVSHRRFINIRAFKFMTETTCLTHQLFQDLRMRYWNLIRSSGKGLNTSTAVLSIGICDSITDEASGRSLPPLVRYHKPSQLGASHTTWHVRASAVFLTASHGDALPGPSGASTGSADDHNVVSAAGNCSRSRDGVQGETCDWDARSGSPAIKVSAVVVLLNEDAVPDARKKIWISDLEYLLTLLGVYSLRDA